MDVRCITGNQKRSRFGRHYPFRDQRCSCRRDRECSRFRFHAAPAEKGRITAGKQELRAGGRNYPLRDGEDYARKCRKPASSDAGSEQANNLPSIASRFWGIPPYELEERPDSVFWVTRAMQFREAENMAEEILAEKAKAKLKGGLKG